MKPTNSIEPGGVELYIKNHTDEVQVQLKAMRSAIIETAPGSEETVSYFQIPGYFYKDYDYNGMFAWFSFKEPFIRLHVRPPVLENHKEELANFKTTKAIISFPINKEIPTKIVKKLVEESIQIMKQKK